MLRILKRFMGTNASDPATESAPDRTAVALDPPHESEAVPAPAPASDDSDRFAVHYDGLIFDPMMRAYYGSREFYNVGYWDDSCHLQAEASTNMVARLLSQAQAEVTAVLDVGCGLGATTRQVKERWPAAGVIGINISEAQVEHCRQSAPDCEFLQMDATRLEFADARFDVVLCVEAAFHFDTRQEFLQEAYRVLKPGGTLLLADILFAEGPYADAVSVWKVAQSNALPDMNGYRNALAQEGFGNIRLEDATDRCWGAWCRSLKVWLEANRNTGTVTEAQWKQWQASLPGLATAVRHYILAAAQKPSV